ncbi:MAG: DUF916 domain-containing protein [Candidatus Moranbacteria bacterium]|nr:DUF916 domain-containing protein [Candidatus Moranbacteria bacterium]
MINKSLSLLFLAVFIWIGSATLVKAIGFTPVSVDIKAAPGQSYQDSIKVINRSEKVIYYHIILKAFRASQAKAGSPKFSGNELSDQEKEFLNWIKVQDQVIQLQPKQVKRVKYQITVPEEAQAGGYYFGILFSKTGQDVNKQALGMRGLSGPIFLMTVTGNLIYDFQLKEFRLSLDPEHQNLTCSVNLENKGNVHVKPQGKIQFKQNGLFLNNQQLIESRDFNILSGDHSGSILPKTNRKWVFDFAVKSLPLFWTKYQCQLDIVYQDIHINQKRDTTYINWRSIIAILTIIAILSLVILTIKWLAMIKAGKEISSQR